LVKPEDVTVTLKTEIDKNFPLVVCVDLLSNIDQVFGKSSEIGSITIQTVQPSQFLCADHQGESPETLSVHHHPEHNIYTISIPQQPALEFAPFVAHSILNSFHPTNLVILTSSKAVPSNIPVSFLSTSTSPTAIGGQPADRNPLFSNRRITTPRDIQARIAAHQHPQESDELPLLQPPHMIQGIPAALISSAEIYGIHATCLIISTWLGEDLEKRDVEKLCKKLNQVLKGLNVDAEAILKGWNHSLGIERSTIYL